jgi:hypothetical protein
MEALTTTAIFPAGSSFAVSSFRRAANLLQHEGIVNQATQQNNRLFRLAGELPASLNLRQLKI